MRKKLLFLRWTIPLLLIFHMLLCSHEARGADPNDMCKEYGTAYPEQFKDLCAGKQKATDRPRWKLEDDGAFEKFLESACRSSEDYYWDGDTNQCEKVPQCDTGFLWSTIYLECQKWNGPG